MTYLILDIAIIFFPLILSFEKKVKFYRYWFFYFFSVVSISSIYILWDILATKRGDWAFSELHTIGIHIFNLPIEEIIFFFVVPYSIIFIYETFNHYFQDKFININHNVLLIISFGIFIFGLFNISRNYTFTNSLFLAISLYLLTVVKNELINSRNFWYTILVSFIPFLIVNYILTSIPIVTYNSSAIIGIRFTTIPMEDFAYSFSMITLWLLFYSIGKKV
jgi:lycopene cyclase domain-containing protein